MRLRRLRKSFHTEETAHRAVATAVGINRPLLLAGGTAGGESMNARAAVCDRIPAELDIVGIEIPASGWSGLLQDSITARIVQKRIVGIARDAEVIA